MKNASDLLEFDDTYTHNHKRSNSINLFSDYFRYLLFKNNMGVWSDLDCFFLKPITVPEHGYVMGHEIKTINSAVLRLPSNCPMLDDLIHACQNPTKSPYWLDFRRKYIKRLAYFMSGKKWHLGNMRWGIVGPVALTRLVPHYNLLDKVQPMKTFYPLDRQGTEQLYDPKEFGHITNDPEIRSIHIYAKERKNEPPIPGSFIAWATENVADFL